MKTKIFSIALLAASAALLPATESAGQIELGLQAFTFRRRTFAETLDRAAAMKIKYVQAYRRQKISSKRGPNFDYATMTDATKAEIRSLLKAKGIILASYGVVTGKNEEDWRKIFAFAKDMGVRDIATEPKPEDLPLVAKLSAETGVAVTIHNHPPPTRYADPDTVLAAIEPHGKNIGICADTGHWARAGHDPVATLGKVAGRIISVHFKDLTERGVKAAHDVPWGTGTSDAALQIAELRRQGFNGIVYMEYERMSPALDAETAASADWFHRAIAASDADLRAGRVLPAGYVAAQDIAREWSDKQRNSASGLWPSARPLFAPDLSNAEYKPGTWEYAGGVLTANGGGNIWTKETYADFALNLDFRCEAGSNSGVLLRCSDIANWQHTAIEVQILQGDAPSDKQLVGGIFDISAPSRQIEIAPGQWYHLTIIAHGQKIQVSLDGEQVTKIDLGKWKEAGKNPDGTGNKFHTAYSKMAKRGRIGLQYHGTPISFRNLVIERVDP